jgi:hypothetical protein
MAFNTRHLPKMLLLEILNVKAKLLSQLLVSLLLSQQSYLGGLLSLSMGLSRTPGI